MKSTSETGHAKNVGNFEVLISSCTGFGTMYNPSNPALYLNALETIHNNALNSVTSVNSSLSAYNMATDDRETAFSKIGKLSTRIINALSASPVSKEAVDDAKTYTRKLQGRRATRISAKKMLSETPAVEAHKIISASQLSFDNRISNFDKLVQHLSAQSGYAPNETELKVTTLNAFLSELVNKNTAAINAFTALNNTRIARNKVLYDSPIGLVPVASEVKKYVKSVFGSTSPEFRQISKIQFYPL